MKQALFISFDLQRQGEIETPFPIASILAFLKNDRQLQDKISFHYRSINILKFDRKLGPADFNKCLGDLNFENLDYVAISAYIWNEYLINDFIGEIRRWGFRGKIILGGYQITYSGQKELPLRYPDAQIFISGHAEQSLKELFTSTASTNLGTFLNSDVDFSELPSAYLTNEIKVPIGTQMLRFETKRGCPNRCSFCAHRDLKYNKVYNHSLDKVFKEISFITNREVKRVNILDPVFNTGKEYLKVMKEINRVNTSTIYTLQSRFENIKGIGGAEFLDMCSDGSYHLEFGLQTTNTAEAENVNRRNNLQQIDEVINRISERNISYEISLIYGLPGQTVDSFKRSIDYVQNKGCKTIKAFPLMLLRGTELYHNKQKWNLNEEAMGEFNIPVVTSSNSFSRHDWELMDDTANNLSPNYRL